MKGWFDVSTLKEPYRVEGKKTMGFELAEQFEWELPDVIIYPTGGGYGYCRDVERICGVRSNRMDREEETAFYCRTINRLRTHR